MIDELQRAISLAGTQTKLVEKVKPFLPPDLKIGQSHISSWLHRDGKVPAEYCQAIEKAFDGEIKSTKLRPDIFGEL